MFKNILFFLMLYYSVFFFKTVYDRTKSPSYLEVFDVGQGDSIFFHIKDVGNIVIDAGNDYEIDDAIHKNMTFLPCRFFLGLVTHAHKDHYGGFFRLLERCYFEYFLVSEIEAENSVYRDLISKIRFKHPTKVVYLKDGDKFSLGGLSLDFFIPAEPHKLRYQNNPNLSSIVTLISYKDFHSLLTGDAELPVLRSINLYRLRSLLGESGLEFFKVPHHGSLDSFDPLFIGALTPKISSISVGKVNSYKHPSPEVINYLSNISLRVHRTDLDGPLTIYLPK